MGKDPDDLGKVKKKNAVKAGIGTMDDIKAPFLTRFIFQLVIGCMCGIMFTGMVLMIVGSYYSGTASAGMGDSLMTIGAASFVVGGLGAASCWKRSMAGMVVSELLLLGLFIALYVAAIVSFMMASGATNPVDKGVEMAWDQGLRRDVLEKEADRWCKKNTDLLGPCKIFYERSLRVVKMASQAGDNSCNMSVTEMALNCEVAHTMCGSTVPLKTSCNECDQECKAEIKVIVKNYLKPATYVNFVLFGCVFMVIILINYLLEQPTKSGAQMQLSYLLNGCVSMISFVAMLLMGVVLSKGISECPANQDCSSGLLVMSFLVIVSLVGISALTIVGLYSDNNLFLRIGALAYVVFGFLLLMVAIVLGMAGGMISDVGAYYNENWPEIRLELNEAGFCDQNADGSHIDPVGDDGEYIRPTAPDPFTDPCKAKMELETESQAVGLFAWATVVIISMAATIYFNLRGIKQLSMLGDYQERIMGDVTEARAAMMMEQAKVLAERNALEQRIAGETAKLEARMKELGDGSNQPSSGKKKGKQDKKGKAKRTVDNPLMTNSDDEME